MKYSVIVVGAGASGVATATRLLQGGVKNIGKFMVLNPKHLAR
jgi:cation diffusion facilitator CzcD-associated flavoprotein CzcO